MKDKRRIHNLFRISKIFEAQIVHNRTIIQNFCTYSCLYIKFFAWFARIRENARIPSSESTKGVLTRRGEKKRKKKRKPIIRKREEFWSCWFSFQRLAKHSWMTLHECELIKGTSRGPERNETLRDPFHRVPFVALGIKNRGSKRDRVANFARALQPGQLQVVKCCKNANTIGAAVVATWQPRMHSESKLKSSVFFVSFSPPLFLSLFFFIFTTESNVAGTKSV